jgi:hypothetical protein
MGGEQTTNIPVRGAVDPFETFSQGRLPDRTSLQVACERERRYFVPLEALDKVVDLDRLEHDVITQSYLSAEGGAVLVALLHTFGWSPPTDQHAFTQARIRETYERSAGRFTHELVVKLKHPDDHPTERLEITLPLDERAYERLAPLTVGWRVVKQRHHLMESARGGFQLEIDTLIALTRDGESVRPPGEQFAIIDCEVADRKDLARLVSRRTKHPILSRCIDISPDVSDRDEQRKPLSWRRLAEKGFDKRARRALTELHAAFRAGER